ncbi:MAG: LicD family protein [Bacteroidales bacterium]|nr:LicD family protein [Bacteroidales bacterium]
MNLRDSISIIASNFGKISILKKLLRSPYDYYKNWPKKREFANFKKYGFEALVKFDECLTKHNIKYSLAFGTLLGAVREHDFIPHDDDLDFAMWIEDYKPDIIKYLKESGINLKYRFSVDNDNLGKLDTFVYKGVFIDIFYFYHDEDGRAYCCDFKNQPDCRSRTESVKKHGGLRPRKLYMPLGEGTERISFKDVNVMIPTNYKEILAFRYGEDYMTPKPGWRPNTKYVVEAEQWIGKYEVCR